MSKYLLIQSKSPWESGDVGHFYGLARELGIPWRVIWHLPSILGWAFALILTRFAYLPDPGGEERFVLKTISVSLLVCAVLVFAGTRRHPGWAAFLAAAVLSWVGAAGP